MMKETARALVYGCGPIGCTIARLVSQRSAIDLVGAIDNDPGKVGKDLGEIAGLGQSLGVAVSSEVSRVLAESKPDIAFHTTSSQLDRVHQQIAGLVQAGVNVVSTCEELSFPFRRHPELSTQLDRLAREHQVTILSTGVNPGFLMDTWPLFMTGVAESVEAITVVRVQDAASRRLPFQKKIGAGATQAEFDALVAAGSLRHVGLPESIGMIARGLGWQLQEVTETIDAILAQQEVGSQYLTVQPGHVAGVRQVGTGIVDGRPAIILDFQAYVGAPESYDSVSLTGVPSMEVTIRGGINGDIATAALVVNTHRRVMDAPPGLLTMADLPIVACGS